jgi:hypothetical protein
MKKLLLILAVALTACGPNWIVPEPGDETACDCGGDHGDYDGEDDAGTPTTPDSGTPTTPDSGTPTSPDAGTPDAGTPDAGTPDPGTPDSGTPPKQCKNGYGWGDDNHCHIKSCNKLKPGKK